MLGVKIEDALAYSLGSPTFTEHCIHSVLFLLITTMKKYHVSVSVIDMMAMLRAEIDFILLCQSFL